MTDLLERINATADSLNAISEPFLAEVVQEAHREIVRLRRALQKVSRFPLHHPNASDEVREAAAIAMDALTARAR